MNNTKKEYQKKKMKSENTNFFQAAIVEDGIITNILVFDNENTMREFNALPLAEGQGIGDKYLSPEEYADKKKVKQLVDAALSELNAV